MVYVGANDGMLHAFNATTGAEAWAFIPRAVLPSLYQLADDGYSTRHRFFVDGTPTASDVFDGTNWRTIVVGGLNKGGKSFYALDVTDPASPKALWEFTDANLGYTYGNPLIGKLKDGHDTWAVFLTSGANNADGQGHLYVLNAVSGALIREIVTPSGSNLMKIAGWSDDDPVLDNTVSHVYGTDLDGNIWRFDVNDTIEPAGHEATLLMATKDSLGNSQPISTKPELGLVGTDIYVYVGTGQYLGDFDLSTTGKQSIYGIKDTMRVPTTTGGMVVTNGRADLQAQVLVQTGDSAELTTKRKVESCVSAPAGWYVDLPDSKERVNVDMKLQLGSLIVPSNVPGSDACQAGGYSWLNYFNANNGCSNTDTKIVSERLSDSLAVGINIVRLPSNKTVAIATTSDSGQITLTPPFSISNPEGRRLTWREINPP
jgi:type IV pilus assembly protein PilY1